MRIKMKHDDTPPTPPRAGGTFQVGLGAGWIHLSDEYGSLTSPQGTAGLSLGYGSWLTPEAALFLRASAVTVPYSDGALTEGFLGPAFQLWVAKATWVGIGLGACLLDIRRDARARGVQSWGLGGNVRVGHTLFERSGHALDISLELTPAAFNVRAYTGGDNVTIAGTSVGLLVGYQLL
jgi:hypothetical protein